MIGIKTHADLKRGVSCLRGTMTQPSVCATLKSLSALGGAYTFSLVCGSIKGEMRAQKVVK
jgi:hypothetical protein